MKRIFFTLFLFLFSFIVFSQKIDGVGKFRIDKTSVSIITDIERENKIHFSITNELDFSLNKGNFNEILLDSSTIRLFYISEYVVYDIKLTNIYLYFYNDNLIQFRCDVNKDMNMLLARKYGRPIIDEKRISNVKNQSLNLIYDESYSKYTWINTNILTISFERKQFFDGITRYADSYFKIFDITYGVLINKIKIN